LLYTYLKKAICIFNVLEIGFGYLLDFLYQVKSPDDFILYFLPLFDKELRKIIFVKNNRPTFLFICDDTNILKVARKCNMIKNYFGM
jgi:hypothetical protein